MVLGKEKHQYEQREEEKSRLQQGGQHVPETMQALVRNNGTGQRVHAGKWGEGEHLVEVKRGQVIAPWRPGQPI